MKILEGHFFSGHPLSLSLSQAVEGGEGKEEEKEEKEEGKEEDSSSSSSSNSNSEWYLIDKRWHTRWLRPHHSHPTSENPFPAPHLPPAIDNDELVKFRSSPLALKRGVVQNLDFVVLPPLVYEALENWYGGGPRIRRAVKLGGDLEQQVEIVELHPNSNGNGNGNGVETTPSKSSSPRGLSLSSPFSSPTSSATKRRSSSLFRSSNNDSPNSTSNSSPNTPTSSSAENSYNNNNNNHGNVGLSNLGNTCYLNASVQCLSHTPILNQYFTSGMYLSDVNIDNKVSEKEVTTVSKASHNRERSEP